jgi:hypothetical protein
MWMILMCIFIQEHGSKSHWTHYKLKVDYKKIE